VKPFFNLLVSGLWLLVSQNVHAIIDSNSNAMSDVWERQFNDNQLFATTFLPGDDADHDGQNNLLEAIAGTDPLHFDPPVGHFMQSIRHVPATWLEVPEEEPVMLTPEAYEIEWHGLPGKQYVLSFSNDLTDGSWHAIGEPIIGSGTAVMIGCLPEQEGGGLADKLFWRVAVEDIDSDGDTWTNAEESRLGTNAFVKDTDADGMDDNVDPQPNTGFPTFPDADGDGIADADDPEPNASAGLPPVVTSETANTSRIVNVAAGEPLVFLVTVENPDGPSVTASDLKLFVSGVENNATFTPAGQNRFSVAWNAEVHASYPATLLQNLSVRFRDSRLATTWLELARLDVAEWQGMVAGLAVSYDASSTRTFSIGGHSNGIQMPPTPWCGEYGVGPRWYRGPRVIPYHGRGHDEAAPGMYLGTLSIAATMRYPLFIIDDSDAPVPPVVTVKNVSDPSQYPHGFWGLNQWSGQIKVVGTGATSIIEANTENFIALPQPVGEDIPFVFEVYNFRQGEWYGNFSNIWPVPARTWSRKMHAITAAVANNDGVPSAREWSLSAPIEARMVASAAGSLEIPGLPMDHQLEEQPLFMAPNQWHRIVVKAGPDAAVVARGVRLRFNSGSVGTEAAQSGVEFKRKTATGFENYTPDEMLEGSDLYNAITGQDGLVLFAKLPPSVDQLHRLSLDLLPNGETLEPLEIRNLAMVPVGVDDNLFATGVDDVSITAQATGKGYQNKFWIMAPAGNDPSGNPCSNDMVVKLPVEPDSQLRMDCTHAACEYRHPVSSTAASPPVPVGHGMASAVRWLGTGAESGDHAPIYKLGDAQTQVDLPIAVKTMKRRTVKVNVYYVRGYETDDATGEKKNYRAPLTQPNKTAIENKLNEVFARQVNAWFDVECFDKDVEWDVGIAAEWGVPGFSPAIVQYNRVLDLGGDVTSVNQEDRRLVQSEEEKKLLAAREAGAVDIDVFVVGGSWLVKRQYGIAGGLAVGGDTPGLAMGNPLLKVVHIAGQKDGMGQEAIPVNELLYLMAHEVGHVIIGLGHPDQDGGAAPLPGTNRMERLMYSDMDEKKNAGLLDSNRLVKAEWDAAEAWMKKNPDKRE
jgi:hypothetical protein